MIYDTSNINTFNKKKDTSINIPCCNTNNMFLRKFHTNNCLKIKEKITGRNRHHAPANKEWKDSVYLYNKNSMKAVPVKHDMVNKLVRNHFNINSLKKIARSRRMRSRIIRSSTRRLFVSNPEIKQNNDKTIITVYAFNREKQFYIRKLFFHARRPIFYNLWLKNGLQKKVRYFNLVSKRKLIFKKRNQGKPIKKLIPYYGINFKNETDFLRYKLSSLYKKYSFLDKFFMYSFISRILSLFNIKLISSFNIKNKRELINNILSKKPNTLLWIDGKVNTLKIINTNGLDVNIINKIVYESNVSNTLTGKGFINNLLWQFILNNLIYTGYISYNNINYLYKIFVYKKYKKIIYKFFKKGAKFYYNFGKLQINKLKFTDLLPVLKTLISRIYNNNTELNIVNLKYIHLNTDIFTQAIALKLRKKKSLLRVLRKSLKLVKVPFEFYYSKKKPSLNNLLDMNSYKSLDINKIPSNSIGKFKNNDLLNNMLERLFPNSIIHGINKPTKKKDIYYTNNKMIDVLDTVKFKWVTGLRLEAAGRLTRRNTASRSLFKFKYKGNLENKQHYIDLGILKIMPPIMLRNVAKVNTQYTLTNSKRRIGSFGIKSWISGY